MPIAPTPSPIPHLFSYATHPEYDLKIDITPSGYFFEIAGSFLEFLISFANCADPKGPLLSNFVRGKRSNIVPCEAEKK